MLRDATLQARSAAGPLLALSCARSGGAQLVIDTAQPLAAGQSGQPASATLKIGEAPAQPVTLVWAVEPPGSLRVRDPAEAGALATGIAASELVTLRLQQTDDQELAVAWQLFLIPPQRRALQRACRPKATPTPAAGG